MLSKDDQSTNPEDDYLNRLGTLVSSRVNKEKEIQAQVKEENSQPQVSFLKSLHPMHL